MAFIHFRKVSKSNYTPANFNANEITAVWNVAAGDVIGGAFVRIRTAYDGTTVKAELGDGTDRNGFITDSNAAVTATGLKKGTGALLTIPGHLYTSADTIDVNYTLADTDSTGVGRSDWWVWIAKADPH